MSKYPGESLLTTSYADIFYPSGDPVRFELSCYFYLYRHQITSRGRLEIANSPGQPSQDSFFGFLDDLSVLQYSYDQPSRVLFDVKPAQAPTHEWMMNFKASGRSRIRRMIVYFWKAEDAIKVVEHVKTCVPPTITRITGRPVPMAQTQLGAVAPDRMNSLPQNLERASLSSQAYPVRSISSNSGRTGISFAPPPLQPEDDDDDTQVPPTPSAYNPAAPAKPERRAHRQKTPPPLEEDQPGVHSLASTASFLGQPAGEFTSSQRYAGPGITAASQVPLSPIGTGPGISAFPMTTPLSPIQTGFGATLSRQPYAGPLSPVIMSMPPAKQDTSTPINTSASAAAPPLGGYSDYQYSGGSDPRSGQITAVDPYEAHQLHNQVYRPTEDEFSHQKGHAPQSQNFLKAGTAGATLKLDERARQIDKGVGRLGKWLEKKVG